MLAKWLIRGILGERSQEHKNAKMERKSAKLAHKISRLDVKAAKIDYMATKCQYKSQHKKLSWRQKKWQKKADNLLKQASKLQEISRPQEGTQPEAPQVEPEATGRWVKDQEHDITILPPRYEDVCLQHQPPPYEENVTEKTKLYPVLM
ncbi:unnamed protein product [Candidula unifasciata]|uniref:Uncharacterized protein n=1 Tax=Candidula unifasciata TaxID=100452 RepID=A0A8S3Z2N8_9EUPU|nr:unnamed protein product [Candidula unifasciata]